MKQLGILISTVAIASAGVGAQDDTGSLETADITGDLPMPVIMRPPPRTLPDDVPADDATRALPEPRLPETPAPIPPVVEPKAGSWKLDASLSLRVGYDSNVYLQDVGPLSSVDSIFTSAAPRFGLSFTPDGAKSPLFAMAYAPIATWFHDASGEDNISHGVTADVNVGRDAWSFNMFNSVTLIDGPSEGLIFDQPGGAPAIGGLAVRDRRDALIYRGTIKAQYSAETWFVRPISQFYFHDFQTRQLATPGYQNYADRSDINVGLDSGLKVAKETFLTLGYRAGWQSQQDVLAVSTDYANSYHRVLFGVEAKPTNWFTLNGAVGPDFRNFDGDTPVGFDDSQTFVFANVSATLKPTERDTLTALVTRLVQPGFGGRSAYEDSAFSLTWKHTRGKFTASLAGKANRGDFLSPVQRDDWVYTVSPSVEYKINPHASVEVGYAYELGDSQFDATPGRDYERHVTYAAVKLAY
jgi:hypothetical protein